jgi:UDP-3-O-[3-hydroxymyristoyl] N-acetylglucosamine deacetylase
MGTLRFPVDAVELNNQIGHSPEVHPVRPKSRGLLVQGVGLHTGRSFDLRIHSQPGSEGGVRFFSRFEGVTFSAPALWTRVSGTSRATALVLRGESRRKLELKTVEHFMAAAIILGLSLDVEVVPSQGEAEVLEIPTLDGSALEWVRCLERLRVPEAPLPHPVWKVLRSFEVRDGDRRLLISPIEGPKASFYCNVDFGPAWRQSLEYSIDWTRPGEGRRRFIHEVAPARTFGFRREVEHLLSKGLARGGSLENALLLDDDRVINNEGFRVPQELAAHKLLDALGDFALLGAPLLGRVDLFQAGHQMHLRAVEEAVRTGVVVKGRVFPDGHFVRD